MDKHDIEIPEQDLILDRDGTRITSRSAFDLVADAKKAGYKRTPHKQESKGLLGRLIGGDSGGRGGRLSRVGTAVRKYVRKVPLDPDAWDADRDGLVQEGTTAERKLTKPLHGADDALELSGDLTRSMHPDAVRHMTDGPTPLSKVPDVGGATIHAHPDAVLEHHKKMVERIEKVHGTIKTPADATRALRKAFPNLVATREGIPKFKNQTKLTDHELGFVHGLLYAADLNPDAAKSVIQFRTTRMEGASVGFGHIPDGRGGYKFGHIISLSSTGGAWGGDGFMQNQRLWAIARSEGRASIPHGAHNSEDPYIAAFFDKALALRKAGKTKEADELEQTAAQWMWTSVGTHEMTHVIHIVAINKDRGVDLTNQRNQRKVLDSIVKAWPPGYDRATSAGQATSWSELLEAFNGDVNAALKHVIRRVQYNDTSYANWRRGRVDASVPWDSLTQAEIDAAHPMMRRISQYARKNPLEAFAEASSQAFMGVIEWDDPILKKLIEWMKLQHKSARGGSGKNMLPIVDGVLHFCTDGDGHPGFLIPEIKDPPAETKGLLGRLIGTVHRGRNSSGSVREALEKVPFDPDPLDGDGDGMVQEGTNQMRRLSDAIEVSTISSLDVDWPGVTTAFHITDGPRPASELTSRGATLHAHPDLVRRRAQEISKIVTDKYGEIKTPQDANRALRKAFPNLVDTGKGVPAWRGAALHDREVGFVHGLLYMAELNPEASRTVISVTKENLHGAGAAVSLQDAIDSKGVVRYGMFVSLSTDDAAYDADVRGIGRGIDVGTHRIPTDAQVVYQPYEAAFAAHAAQFEHSDPAKYNELVSEAVQFMGMAEALHEMSHISHLHAIHKEYGADFSNQRNPRKIYDGMLKMYSDNNFPGAFGPSLPPTWAELLELTGGDVRQALLKLRSAKADYYSSYLRDRFELSRVYDHLSRPDTTTTHAQFGRHSKYAGSTRYEHSLEAFAEAGASAVLGITEWDTDAMRQMQEWTKIRFKTGQKPFGVPAIVKDGVVHFCFHNDKVGLPLPDSTKWTQPKAIDGKSLLGRIGRMGRSKRSSRIGSGARTVLNQEPFDPKAEDGDHDGLVQDGSAFERPVGAAEVTKLARERREMPRSSNVSQMQAQSGARIHASVEDVLAVHEERVAKVTRKWGDVGQRDVAMKALSKAFPNLVDFDETKMNFTNDTLDNRERGFVVGLLHMAEINPEAAKSLISLKQEEFTDEAGRVDEEAVADAGLAVLDKSAKRGADVGFQIRFNTNHNGMGKLREQALSERQDPLSEGFHVEKPYLLAMMRQAIAAERAGDMDESDRIMAKLSEVFGTYAATHEYGHVIHFQAMHKDMGIDFSKQKNPTAIIKQLDEQLNMDMYDRIKAGEDPIAVFTDVSREFYTKLANHLRRRNDTAGFDGLNATEIAAIRAEMAKMSIYARKNDRELFAEAIAAEAGGIITIDTAEMRKLRAWLRLRTKAAQMAAAEELMMSIFGSLQINDSGFTINLCGTGDEPGLRDEPVRAARRSGKPVRVKNAEPTGSLFDILHVPYAKNPTQIDIKAFALAAMIAKTPVVVDFKTGLVGSKDPVVQAAESIVSYGVPGDMSRVRSPLRSTLYRAATPGGGGGGRRAPLGRAIGRGSQAMRCPAGFENGGRFSNRFLNNCGTQLFDVPGIEAPDGKPDGTVIRVTRTIANVAGRGTDRTQGITAGRYSMGGTISRMANVPQVGGSNPKRVETEVASAIAAASASRNDFVHLVRRDGVALTSRVGIAKLATQKTNNDMAGGTVISRASSAAGIGHHEVDVLANGAQSVRMVLPGGHEIRVDRSPNFSTADANTLRRQWGTLRRSKNEDNGLQNLRQLAERSNGKIVYSETFANIENPNEMVRIERNGTERTMPRWQYLSFYADGAPGRSEKDQPWKEVGVVAQGEQGDQVVRTFTSAADARKAIADGAPLDQVSARFMDDVLKDTKIFTITDLGNGRQLVARKNGERYIRTEQDGKVALSDRIASDFGRAMGVTSPTVRLAGTGSRRSLVVDSPENAVKGSSLSLDQTLADAKPADLARIALTDFLTGRRDRNPGSIALLADGENTIPVPEVTSVPNKTAAIIRKPEQFLVADGEGGWISSYVQAPSRQVRQSMIEMYDTLVERAAGFDWSAYLTRLGLDGDLSAADRAHLETVQRLYESRLGQLRSSRKSVLRILGASAS